jgi:hypothetical protein
MQRASRAQVQEAWDNPPISDSFDDKWRAAMQYHEEKRNGWSVQVIYEKSGISRSTFYKGLAHIEDPSKPAPKGLGQQQFLSEAAFAKVYAEVTRLSLHLDAPEYTMTVVDIVKQVLRAEAENKYLEFEFSDSWLQKLKQRFLTVNSASQKTSDRLKAFERMRNPLSLCAGLWMMYSNGLREEQFYSSDDVSVLLNKMNEKPKVITTKEAKAILQQQGLSVSTSADVQKQRVVTFNCTISGFGGLVCKVLKFADREFTQFSEKPFVTCLDMGSDVERIYVMLYKYGMEDKVVEEYMYRKCILPEVDRHRKIIEERDQSRLREIKGSQSQSQSSGPHSQPSPRSQQHQQPIRQEEKEGGVEEEEQGSDGDGEEEEEDEIDPSLSAVLPDQRPEPEQRYSKHAALFCDGAFGQIAALRKAVSQRIDVKKLRMLLGKYAGGCSMTQSGNDNGQMHLTLHKNFKSPSFRYEDCEDRPGPVWADLKLLMHRVHRACLLQEHMEVHAASAALPDQGLYTEQHQERL